MAIKIYKKFLSLSEIKKEKNYSESLAYNAITNEFLKGESIIEKALKIDPKINKSKNS